jgi:hypothetical protein
MPSAAIAPAGVPTVQSPWVAPFMQRLVALDDLTDEHLRALAYRLWRQPPDMPGRSAELTAACCALIDLRRSGESRYSVCRHSRRHRIEVARLDPVHARQARHVALRTGEVACVLGERRDGLVAYGLIGQDPRDPFPAPWYVIAMPALSQCRAHGADEIERAPAPAATRPAPAPAGR